MNKTSGIKWGMILFPLAWLYGLIVWIRNALYDQGIFRETSFPIPIISVGNITVGGTGKTPHVEYLAGLLKEEFRIATLSRGYRRKTRDFRIVDTGSAIKEVGDEPMQIKQRYPDITVAVDRKRVNGVTELMKLAPPLEVIILDDAYQHRAIRPGFSLLLIDFNRPVDRDQILPAGRLREQAINRNRANVILVTRTPERTKPIEMREYVNRLHLGIGQHLYFTTIKYGALVPVFRDIKTRDMEWYRSKEAGVLIVTGIASPRGIRQYARSINPQISEISFPDHHRYTRKDLDRIHHRYLELKSNWKEVLVLTTEKDAVKFRELTPETDLREDMHAVRINIHFLNDDRENFDNQIFNYVTSNKRSSILHQGTD